MSDVKTLVEDSGYGKQLGVQLASVDDAGVVLTLPFREGNSNPGGALHGGLDEVEAGLEHFE